MSGFSVAWLDLREAADKRARDPALAAAARKWLQAHAGVASPIVADLGAGTGSTLRALEGGGGCVWRLVDHDGALLTTALKRHGRQCIIEDYQADLAAIDELPLGGATLVTASALFDLVSEAFVGQLVARLVAQRTALYAALNYDGATTWTPGHPFDAAVLAAFNLDQRRDKGFGPALGPDAVACMQSALERAGFSVRLASSPWRLGAGDQTLIAELVRGIASAVADGYGLDAARLQDWQEFRLAHATDGGCMVGHLDLLALPPGEAAVQSPD